MSSTRIALLGFTVPDDLMAHIRATDASPQAQTHRFAWALAHALQENGAEVALFSAAPVSDFPENRQVVWGVRRFSQDGISGVLLPFLNVTVLKHLTRFLGCWIVAGRRLRRSRPDWLLVHGVHSPFLWFAVAFRRRHDLSLAVVLTDPPGFVRLEDGRLKGLLKRLDIAVVKAALKHCDATVVLAEPLARDFAPGVPHLVVEGMATSLSPPSSQSTDEGEPTVVYAGGLLEEYGVKDLVLAFRSLPAPSLRLEIYGRGPLEQWLSEQSELDPRIRPVRLVAPDELAGVYARATVLVQPRPVAQGFVAYSFPSKLTEYLASGTVTVSTRLPSIPNDYEPHVVWTSGGAAGLADALADVLAWPASARASHGAAASRFITSTRSTNAQGARILSFLRRTRRA